ncbi:MAG: hypothetical protein AAFU77_11955 [Myxococcota bacterium]
MLKRAALSILLLSLVSCGATLVRPTPAQLEALDSAEREPVEANKAAVAAAKRSLAELEADVPRLERDVDIAERLIERETADVEVTRLRFEAAQDTRDADAMIPARANRARATAALELAQAQLGREEAALDLLLGRIDEASAAVEVAEAELALAEIRAVQSAASDESPEAAEREAAFETRLAESRATAASEKESVARLQTLFEKADRAYRQAAAKAPADPGQGVEPSTTPSE